MDDLSGLDWSSKPTSQPSSKLPPPMNPSSSLYSSLQPSPFGSGRNTPLSSQGSGLAAQKPAPAKPAQDSFSNLVSFGGAKSATANSNLSLREQQERLEAEKRRKEDERRRQAEAQFGNGQFWDTLGSKPATRTASPAVAAPLPSAAKAEDDDLFAAFKAETIVDNASHYPPPEAKPAARAPGLDLTNPGAWQQNSSAADFQDDDDDPFGLNQMKSKSKGTSAPPRQEAGSDEDDDLLGALGRPVSEAQKRRQEPGPGKPIEDTNESDSDDEIPVRKGPMDPFDKAVEQLVDYGFTRENAIRGLTESGAGYNVQQAANWLLDDAHRQAKERAKGGGSSQSRERSQGRAPPSDGGPAWMQASRTDNPQRRDNRSPAYDGDVAKAAAAMGTNFLKTANSLWKTGQKKVQKAVADFQQPEGDPSQPKWMRTTQQDRMHQPEKQRDATDEALALESGGRPTAKPSRSTDGWGAQRPSRDQSPVVSASSGRSSPMPRWQQSAPAIPDSKSRMSKLAKEDDSLSTYVSPNRRRTPQPEKSRPTPPPEEPDLLFGGSSAPVPHRPAAQRPAAQPAKKASPAPRPAGPKIQKVERQVPAISSIALQSSTRHRLQGTSHFKRGDFAAAHASYSSSLTGIPPSHPLIIVLLTNRALTNLKTGSPKLAVEDADAALAVIGPSCGQDEVIAVATESGTEEKRDMKELYGKALSRKAEALEQMERWADASSVWQLCVERGVGGPPAIQGRQRCQSALAPKPKPKPAARPRPAVADLGPQKSSEAVERLRAANQAAAREDDEKFALSEKVDARIAAWREGKTENLRALLGSLDQVLWEGSGWKKVGLHELVMANKVKIAYMKAIAKTHPDKLPQDASTEVRLIAATVFSTLNLSWDKFKVENGL